MAVPANSTRTSIVHRRTDITTSDYPEQYAAQSDGIFSIPASLGEGRHIFSTVEEPKKGDVIALWRVPETLLAHEFQVTVYRLLYDLDLTFKLGDRSMARTAQDIGVYVETLDQKEKLRFWASEIEAIHKWVGPLPAAQETFKQLPRQQERRMTVSDAATALEGLHVEQAIAAVQAELPLLSGPAGEPLTMSSREISDLLGDRHDNVKRTIERLANRCVIELPPMEKVKNHLGQTVQEYRLDKRSSLIVVARLSPEFTAKVVDRWQELEEAIKQPAKPTAPEFPIPQTYAEALMLAANQAAQIEHQKVRIAGKNAQIADMREDVDALDRIAGADGLFGLRETAAMLQMTEKKFVAWLQQNGWVYRHTGSRRLLCFADKRKAGYATNKATSYTKADGSEGVSETLKFYPAGIIKLAKALNVTLTDGDLRALHGSRKDDAA